MFVTFTGPWQSREPAKEVPLWARRAVLDCNCHFNAPVAVAHFEQGRRSEGAHSLEQDVCEGWTGPWVRIDVSATFGSHTFGGPRGAEKAWKEFGLATGTTTA